LTGEIAASEISTEEELNTSTESTEEASSNKLWQAFDRQVAEMTSKRTPTSDAMVETPVLVQQYFSIPLPKPVALSFMYFGMAKSSLTSQLHTQLLITKSIASLQSLNRSCTAHSTKPALVSSLKVFHWRFFK